MRTYNELSLDERVEIQRRLEAGDSLRAIARSLGRAASTISREHRRASSGVIYRAQAAQRRARRCRRKPRVLRKLDDPALRSVVHELRNPGQRAAKPGSECTFTDCPLRVALCHSDCSDASTSP